MLRNDCFFEEDAKEYWDYFGEKFSENDRYVYINRNEGIVVSEEMAKKLAKDYKTEYDKVAESDFVDDIWGEVIHKGERYIEIEGYTCKLNNDTTIEVALDLDEVTSWNDERVMSEIEEYVEVA